MESLSSWLRRTASSYGMYSHQLLEHGPGHRELSDAELDLNPPLQLLDELANRCGLDQRRVSAMTLAGWVPWLYDSLTPATDTYETHMHQFSLLLPPGRRISYAPRNWVRWWWGEGAGGEALGRIGDFYLAPSRRRTSTVSDASSHCAATGEWCLSCAAWLGLPGLRALTVINQSDAPVVRLELFPDDKGCPKCRVVADPHDRGRV